MEFHLRFGARSGFGPVAHRSAAALRGCPTGGVADVPGQSRWHEGSALSVFFSSDVVACAFSELADKTALGQIEKDLIRTFPDNAFFAELGAPGTIRLRRVLGAYAWFRPKVGDTIALAEPLLPHR